MPRRRGADYPGMATFWYWVVRNPMVLLAGLAVASGFAEVLEWSPALALALPCALMAEAADWLGGRATERAEEHARQVRRAQSKIVALTPLLDEHRRKNAA